MFCSADGLGTEDEVVAAIVHEPTASLHRAQRRSMINWRIGWLADQ
jgi:hypothetical protein